MKLRLFAIRDVSTNRVLPEYFDSKELAKKERDFINKTSNAIHIVTYGPDHARYNPGAVRNNIVPHDFLTRERNRNIL